jgi:nucleoside phosphorylase
VLSRSSARLIRVAVACLGGAGNVTAAATAAELAQAYKPRLIVMVGIAAGIRDKCRIGDVVFSERVVAYEPAALHVAEGLGSRILARVGRLLGLGTTVRQGRPEMYRLAHAVEQDVVAYLASTDTAVARLRTALAAMRAGPPSSGELTGEVRPRMATIASGEKLLRDPAMLAGLRSDTHGKIEVGEMEAAGIAEASRRHGIDFLIVRGISDFGDSKKTDEGHLLASAGAAAVAVDFVREGLRLGPRTQVGS